MRRDPPREVILRPIERTDIDACVGVFYLAVDNLLRRLDQPLPPRDPGGLSALIEHLLCHDGARAWLAEEPSAAADPEPPTVLGFGAAALRDTAWHLALLYVRPEAQGVGVGRRLLRRCFPGATDSGGAAAGWEATEGPSGAPHAGSQGTLSLCVDSIQPVSTGLYAQYGIVPRVPIYTVMGLPERHPLPALPRDVISTPFDGLPASYDLPGALDSLDRELLGYARPEDHAFWLGEGRRGVLFRSVGAGTVLGYGYTQPLGRLGPVALLDPTLFPAALGALLRRETPPGHWMALVPGSNDRALVALLRAGFRFDGFPAVFASTRPMPALDCYLPAGFALP